MIKAICLILFLSLGLRAEDKNIEILKEKLLLAARAENLYFKKGFDTLFLKDCEKNYLEIFNLLKSVSEEEQLKNPKFYSRVCDRIAGFMAENSNTMNPKEISDLFSKSFKLCNKNYFAYFKAYRFYKTREIKLAREYLLRSYDIKPTVPEIILEMLYYLYDDEKIRFNLQNLFLENQLNYLPELYYFDIGYQQEMAEMSFLDDKNNKIPVKRKIKFKETDDSRFQLLLLE